MIANADEWMTRDNPEAPIARLDDRVRITVIDEIDTRTGELRSRLSQLVLGAIVIDSSFNEFLHPDIIASLVRRDHFWRDESVVEFTGSGEPYRMHSPRDIMHDELLADRPQELPRIRIGLDESSIRIGDRVRLFEALGYEMLALPGTSYGRLRTGLVYDRLRMWAELPLPFGNSSTPVFARNLEASFGAGLSFDAEHFSGAITWSDASNGIGAPAHDGDSLFIMSRSALFTWTIPLRDLLGTDALLLRVGGAYQQFVPLVTVGGEQREGNSIDVPKLLVRAEYSRSVEGDFKRAAAAEVIGTSVLVSYHEQFSRLFGVRIVAAAHGLVGDRPSYLPAYSILLTPTISIW
ncbi:MAG: hypothetical protein H7X80_03695 [bacterium]|nr:hypothetical protein [Candidatus Kapabacteria bacterium]